jgi:hypothetical protein
MGTNDIGTPIPLNASVRELELKFVKDEQFEPQMGELTGALQFRQIQWQTLVSYPHIRKLTFQFGDGYFGTPPAETLHIPETLETMVFGVPMATVLRREFANMFRQCKNVTVTTAYENSSAWGPLHASPFERLTNFLTQSAVSGPGQTRHFVFDATSASEADQQDVMDFLSAILDRNTQWSVTVRAANDYVLDKARALFNRLGRNDIQIVSGSTRSDRERLGFGDRDRILEPITDSAMAYTLSLPRWATHYPQSIASIPGWAVAPLTGAPDGTLTLGSELDDAIRSELIEQLPAIHGGIPREMNHPSRYDGEYREFVPFPLPLRGGARMTSVMTLSPMPLILLATVVVEDTPDPLHYVYFPGDSRGFVTVLLARMSPPIAHKLGAFLPPNLWGRRILPPCGVENQQWLNVRLVRNDAQYRVHTAPFSPMESDRLSRFVATYRRADGNLPDLPLNLGGAHRLVSLVVVQEAPCVYVATIQDATGETKFHLCYQNTEHVKQFLSFLNKLTRPS